MKKVYCNKCYKFICEDDYDDPIDERINVILVDDENKLGYELCNKCKESVIKYINPRCLHDVSYNLI